MGETLADVIPARPEGKCVVSLDQNQTVGDAMRILAQNSLLSAPVMSAPSGDSELLGKDTQAKLLGWVDVNEIVREFAAAIEDKLQGKNMLHMMAVLEQEGPAFAERQLSSLLEEKAEGREQVLHSERSMPLQTAVHNFFVGRGGDMPAIHRLAILSSSGHIEHIITQMDILKFMYERHSGVTAAQQSLEEAGFLESGAGALTTVDINASTMAALSRLVRGGRSAVAVLSPDGSLVTNLSTSDLRYLQPNHFGVLALPVGEFLGLLHDAVYVGACAVDGDLRRSSSTGAAASPRPVPVQPAGGQHQFFAQRPGGLKSVPLITCGKDTPVTEAIRMMVHGHVHRVYLVDNPGSDAAKPLAVITTADMIHFLSQNAYPAAADGAV